MTTQNPGVYRTYRVIFEDRLNYSIRFNMTYSGINQVINLLINTFKQNHSVPRDLDEIYQTVTDLITHKLLETLYLSNVPIKNFNQLENFHSLDILKIGILGIEITDLNYNPTSAAIKSKIQISELPQEVSE